MKQQNGLPAEFCDLLAEEKKKQYVRSRFLGFVERLSAMTRLGAVCGSWVEQDGSRSLLVSQSADGFSLLLCDNTRCYKKILRELSATATGRRLMICNNDAGAGGDISLDQNGVLHCGALGLYRREEDLLREELMDEMEFALRGNETINFDE